MSSDDLILGVDVCNHMLRALAALEVKDESSQNCPVCVRRWRIVEARGANWEPTTHDEAMRNIDRMAEHFAESYDKSDPAGYRGFYAHLARCRDCEADFASAVAAALAPPRDAPPVPARARWREIDVRESASRSWIWNTR